MEACVAGVVLAALIGIAWVILLEIRDRRRYRNRERARDNARLVRWLNAMGDRATARKQSN